jgi:hypothetical protein
MSKFTNGPWEIEEDCPMPNNQRWIIIKKGPHGISKEFITGGIFDEANARLIAQAPAMYELLVKMVAEEEGIGEGISDASVQEMRKILAAIDGE